MADMDFDFGGGPSPYARRRHSPSRPSRRASDFAGIPQNVDPDTCRICRGESTPDEPLFYPCKCSGSIKYVHQDCLMEWLSHSQKKHCELCKTPFRFTKLYSPKMPTTLPVHIFVTHMTKYILSNLVVWLRALLVGCVWLCWLPYLMRRMWSLLFWLSDEGLGSLLLAKNAGSSTASNATLDALEAINSTSTIAENLTASLQDAASTIVPLAFNTSSNETLADAATEPGKLFVFFILKALFPSITRRDAATIAGHDVTPSGDLTPGSLLSNVSFLRNLTRQPTINRFVIMVLEGQIITVLVIVCFILIILVRDYVVQQQPEINMRAAFAGQEMARLDEQVPELIRQRPEQAIQQAPEPAREEPRVPDIPLNDDEEPPMRPLRPENERPVAAFRRRAPRHVDARPDDQGSSNEAASHSDERLPFEGGASSSSVFHSQGPTERHIPEAGPSAVEQYTRAYREVNSDPDADMRLPRRESLRNRSRSHASEIINGLPSATSQESGSSSMAVAASSNQTNADRALSRESYGVRSGIEDVFGPSVSGPSEKNEEQGDAEEEPRSSKARSKQPMWNDEPSDHEEENPPENTVTSINGGELTAYSRPRAVSDGPQPREYINPLANNSWSFSPIPTEPSSPLEDHSEGRSLSPFIFTANDIRVASNRDEFSGTFGDSDHDHDVASDEDDTRRSAPSETFGRLHDDPEHILAQEVVDTEGHAEPVQDATRDTDEAPGPQVAARQPVLARVADFLWGGIEPPTEEEIRAAEAEDDDFNDDDEAAEDVAVGNAAEAGEGGDAAGQAGLDQDALDDIEDFEGIMELIGMRGPIGGLFQNAVFCACLVFIAIFVCIFLPYNLGRTAICVAANPMRLVRMLFAAAKFVQDLTAVVAGALSWATLSTLSVLSRMTGQAARMESVGSSMTYTWELTANASSRLSSGFFDDFPFHASEIQNFSAVSHSALLELKGHVAAAIMAVWNTISFTIESPVSEVANTFLTNTVNFAGLAKNTTISAATSILTPGSWIIDLNSAPPLEINPALASWSGSDRFWAILAGYLSFAFLATLYVTRGAPFSSGQLGQDWEASIVDLINQASGVTKVILIIGIEMLVFPLYCGLLMDAALLPLFEHATIKSRYDFSVNYPLTSIFVHWFVGTGYMFHFALFVSMCRKIMRKGVLDPDDPEFHPVRDVLERNFFTQLRKIMFSALVYGGLVVICLGGVVWTLGLASDVLPIHYSSNEPVLEFPVDLLFYNFLMPLAVRVLRPSDALHAMYTWWFKQCARLLRLTWFLFGQRQVDEEGKLVLPAGSPHHALPWYRKQFLHIDDDNNVAPRTWNDIVSNLFNANPSATRKMGSLSKIKRKLVREGQLRRDGRFVRTPASDQVRIPKGRKVFLDVHETTQVPLGNVPNLEQYFTEQYQLVYLPPHFRVRVFLFIFLIWMFAAVTGVSLTIIPLIVGRRLFKCLLPDHVRTNDIYAFSIGIYVLGTIAYSVFRAGALTKKLRAWGGAALNAISGPEAAKRVAIIVLHGVQLVYAYLNVFIFFPLLASALVELYLIIPLHTYMSPPKAPTMTPGAVPDVGEALAAANSIHTIRAVQAWTLGLLYLKLATRLLKGTFAGTPLANASQAVFRRGWLRPDVKVLTRAFVIPAIVLCLIAIAAPPVVIVPLIKKLLVAAGVFERVSDDPVSMALIYRLSFLSAALVALSSTMVWSLVGVFRGWKSRIRDEAYLIGERLHNFGVGTAVTTRA
ncbi:hypothetical protein jhhlp_001884 [Lomentospora prolificans]|uniref:RING-type E3 ubiquitin transferase n=1 Tax=Lomentospora prolificans TaxID=41688 RepID=A0A2N3NCF1_9PEZI|nr:hypothetical protein jhhlp_001884 [Lomentospora prolificans]